MQINANTKGLGMQENAVTAQSERKKGKQGLSASPEAPARLLPAFPV